MTDHTIAACSCGMAWSVVAAKPQKLMESMLRPHRERTGHDDIVILSTGPAPHGGRAILRQIARRP